MRSACLLHPARLFGFGLLALVLSSSALAEDLPVSPPLGRPAGSDLPRLYVVLIGGMDSDPTPEQIAGKTQGNEGNSGLFRLYGELQRVGYAADYFNWNGTRAGHISDKDPPHAAAICEQVRTHLTLHPSDRLAIVGNSWGGHTAWEVCRELVESPQPLAVETAIFLDPSSFARGRRVQPRTLPVNVNRSTNYYTRNLFGWRKWMEDRRLENIDLADPQHGFFQEGGPAYHAPLDFQAHVAAEWDPKIHADIKQRLFSLVPPARIAVAP